MTSVAGRLDCPFGQRPWNPGIMVFWYSGIPVSWQPSIRALEGVSESLSRYNCREGRPVIGLNNHKYRKRETNPAPRSFYCPATWLDFHLIWLCQKFLGHSIGDCLWFCVIIFPRRWPLISARLFWKGNDIFLRHNISPTDIYHLEMWRDCTAQMFHISAFGFSPWLAVGKCWG